MENSCCHKTKVRTQKEVKDLITRLNRIEGQIRGIKGMIERDAYCTDVLTQVSAANKILLTRLYFPAPTFCPIKEIAA